MPAAVIAEVDAIKLPPVVPTVEEAKANIPWEIRGEPSAAAEADDFFPVTSKEKKDSEEERKPEAALSDWTAAFLTPEARPVLEALGAFVFTFRQPRTPAELTQLTLHIEALRKVARACPGGSGWDGVVMGVCMPSLTVGGSEKEDGDEAWRDVLLSAGVEDVVFADSGRRSEDGEVQGVERIKEALECLDWSSGGDFGIGGDVDVGWDSDAELGKAEEEDDDGFGEFVKAEKRAEKSSEERGELGVIGDEMRGEIDGLREAIEAVRMGEDEDEEMGVERLEQIMGKLKAVREMGVDLPMEERRRIASKAIEELMRM